MDFSRAFEELPLVAILRGLNPADAVTVAEHLVEAGFKAIEVPLNSPSPLVSIRAIAQAIGSAIAVGAGTVYTVEEVRRVREAGGVFVVSPNCSVPVIRATTEAGMSSCPGALSPSEVMVAIDAGAAVVKLFPAQALSIAGFKALTEVVPPSVPIVPVGGVDVSNIADYKRAGAAGAGLGSSVFSVGRTADEVGRRGARLAAAWLNA